MRNYVIAILNLLVLAILGCGEPFALAPGSGGAGGGEAGGDATVTSGGMGGMDASTSTGGTAGMGGSGGTGGGGGPLCEDGIYFTIFSQAGSGGVLTLGTGANNTLTTSYEVHNTNVSDKLTGTFKLVNSLSGDFSTPETTSALEGIRVRCEDPSGNNNYNVVCDIQIPQDPNDGNKHNFDEADCVIQESDNCYRLGGGPIRLQIQVNPVAAGQAKIGFDPATAEMCTTVQDNPLIIVQ